MIGSDHELAVSRDYVTRLERFLEELRKGTRPEEWSDLSSGYLLEIERTQREILDYLARPLPVQRRTIP